MGEFMDSVRDAWFSMLEPPWRHTGTDKKSVRLGHWFLWLIGWAWALAGLVLGALVAPSLVQLAGLSDTLYLDWLIIAIAVLAGFLVQLLGWCLLIAWVPISGLLVVGAIGRIMAVILLVIACLLPFAGVGYALYRYFALVGADQRTVTIAFVGGLLVKTLVIPLIKGIVTGAAFKVLMRWLRGKESKSK